MEKRANQVEPSLDVCGAHTLKVDNGFGGVTLGHQDQAQIIVPIAIRGIEAQDRPEFFFGKIGLFFRDIYVPQIVASSGRAGFKLQRILKRFQGFCIVLLTAVDNSQQIVPLHARGISLKLILNFFLGLFDQPLAEQLFHIRKM